MNKNIKILMLAVGLLFASLLVAPNASESFTPMEAGYSAESTYESRADTHTWSPASPAFVVTSPAYAYDNNNGTRATWAHTRAGGYGTADGYFELKNYKPVTASPRGSVITQVDFKVSYQIYMRASADAWLKLSYYVDPSGTETILSNEQRPVVAWYNLTWTSPTVVEPNDGTWNWEDISNLRFRFTRTDPSTADTGGLMYIVEVWILVHYTANSYDSRSKEHALSPSPPDNTVTNPTQAYDSNYATYATWAHTLGEGYGGLNGYFELRDFKPPSDITPSSIVSVDFKVSYRIVSQASTDAELKVSYFVDPSTTEVILRRTTRPATGWYNTTWTNKREPNDATWNWGDIPNIRFRFTRNDPSTADTGGLMYIVEVWITINCAGPKIYVKPKTQVPLPTSVKLNVTNVEELYGFEFKLYYNKTALTATSVSLGPWLNSSAGGTVNTYGSRIQLDDTLGVVWATQTMTGYRRGGRIASGSWGELATVNFSIDDPGGSSNLVWEVKLVGHNYKIAKIYSLEYALIGPVHDVAATSVSPSPLTVTRGQTVNIDVTVKNKGDYKESFDVTVYAGIAAIETKRVSSLGLGSTTVLSYTWNTRPFLHGSYTIKAVATPITGEAETDDNTFEGPQVTVNPLTGDINSDGYVDEFDLDSLKLAYGSMEGMPNWNFDADINGNGIVDIFDLRLMARNWGK